MPVPGLLMFVEAMIGASRARRQPQAAALFSVAGFR
jgi:hypothetical protein